MVTQIVATYTRNPAANITVTLVEDDGGAAIQGQTVTFTRSGVTTNVVTNVSGQAVFAHDGAQDVAVAAPTNFLVSGNTRGLIANGGASDFDEATGTVTVVAGSGNSALSGRYFAASLTVNLISRSNEQCAPEPFIFEAVPTGFPGVDAPTGGNVYDPRKHVECVWDCDQPKTFTHLSNVFGKMLDGNYAQTTLMGVVYESPGNYTPTATAKKRHPRAPYIVQATGSASTVTVKDIAVEASDKFYVSASGTKAGYTSYTTHSLAYAAATGKTGPVLIEFADNETHTFQYDDQMRSTKPSMYYRREGGGTMPILDWTDANGATTPWQANGYDTSKVKDFVVSGLDIRGTWDSTTETGNPIPLVNQIAGNAADTTLFSECKLSGWGQVINGQDAAASGFFWDCDCTDWQFYGLVQAAFVKTFIRGCRVAMPILGRNGGPKDGAHNNHAGARISTAEHCVVAQNDMFNRCGWLSSNYTIGGNTIYTTQPTFRWGTTPTSGAHLSLWGNTMEGGFDAVTLKPANTSQTLEPCNYVIEANLMMSDWMSQYGIHTMFGGGSIRNNILVMPDTNRDETKDVASFVFMGFTSDTNPSDPENLTAPLVIEHNTVINRLTDANSNDSMDASLANTFSDPNSQFTNVTERATLLHEPAAAVGVTYTNMDLSSVFNSRMTHYYDAADYQNVNYGVTPTATPTLGIPGTASDAAGVVTTATLVYDALGQERDATGDDLGAIKAA